MNPLLRRQLRRAGIDPAQEPSAEALADFLDRVGRTYEDADKSRYLLERSLRLSSDEMSRLYEDLQAAAESEVAAERDRLAGIVDSLAEGVLLLDVTGEVLFCNRAAAAMIGHGARSVVGREGFSLVDLSDGVEPFSTARLMALVGAGGSVSDRDALLHTRDGGKVPIQAHVVGIPSSGAAVVSFLDRRLELKQASRVAESQERFQLLFDHSPVATFELDLTEVGSYFDELRARGIDDLRAFADRNPSQIVEAAERIKVLNANRQGVALFEHGDTAEIIGAFNFNRLDEEDLKGFFALAHAIWRGLGSARVEMALKRDGDERMHVIAAFVAGTKEGWSTSPT